jgi:hypothetical protein
MDRFRTDRQHDITDGPQVVATTGKAARGGQKWLPGGFAPTLDDRKGTSRYVVPHMLTVGSGLAPVEWRKRRRVSIPAGPIDGAL